MPLVALVSLVGACGGAPSNEVIGSGMNAASGGAPVSSGSGSGNGSTTAGAANAGGAGLMINVGGSESGGASSNAGDGTPEECDGVDNDHNGIVDDVDAGRDGVCDCLNIATIGDIGPWSSGGNIFKSWLNARSPIGAKSLADEQITADSLKGIQIAVVLHVATTAVSSRASTARAHHAFSDAEASAFDAWVRAGGGVMTTIGYTNAEAAEIVNVNKLLANLGMGYSTSKLGLSGNVQTWDAHPVTNGITNIFTDNGVEPAGPAGTTVAQGGSGVALQVAQTGLGRVAVWGDEWITYDSEWADVQGQQVEHFWLNLLKWLSPPTQCQVPIPARVK